MLLVMGLTLLIGCANNPISRWMSERGSKSRTEGRLTTYNTFDRGDKYDKSFTPDHGNTYDQGVLVDQSRTYGQTGSVQGYFTEKAANNGLPQEYLSEARIGLTEVDKMFGSARGTELERDATFRHRSAQLWNKRTEAAASEEISLAQVQEFRSQQEAERMTLAASVSSRERRVEIGDTKNDRFVEAWAKEQRTIQHDVMAHAEQEFDEAKAHIEQLRVIRAVTEGEALATIAQMNSGARATRARAEATVAQLRQEAQSVSDKTAARVGELTAQLATIPQRFYANAGRLEAQASAIQDQSYAKAAELRARADATEAQYAEHEYNLMVAVARADRQQAEARNERENTEADVNYERAIIEVERMRADAHLVLENAQTEATRQFGELDAWFQHAKVDVALMRSTADRDEKVARAEFVKVLAKHTADAIRETNEHQQVFSEAQMKVTIAEAETKAAKVHEQLMSELEHLTRSGSVAFSGKTTPTNETMGLDVPVSEKVSAIVPNVDPEAVATFQSALANVLHDRTSADAKFSSLEATYNERKTNIGVRRDKNLAVGSEQLKAAEAFRLQGDATLAETKAAIMAELETARSVFDREIVEAETFRINALTKVAELRAEAKVTLDKGTARVQALRKEAQVILDNGQEEVAAIQEKLRSTENQGEAEVDRLLAEAESVEKGKRALAEEIDAQITAAELGLAAELADLNRQIQSSTVIAETDYRDMLAQAEGLGLQAEMEIRRLFARNAFDRAMAQAEIERLHDIHFVEAIKGDAEVDRRFAMALADRANSDAASDAEQVAIQAQADVFSAEVEAQRRIAAARTNTVKSLFNTRVVEVDTDRIKEKADALVKESRQRANAETILAQAEAAREKTMERMSLMVNRQASLQRAAVQDWDSRLAKNPVQGFNP